MPLASPLLIAFAAVLACLPTQAAGAQLFFRGANTDFSAHRNWKGNTPFDGATPASIVWGAPAGTVSNGGERDRPHTTTACTWTHTHTRTY